MKQNDGKSSSNAEVDPSNAVNEQPSDSCQISLRQLQITIKTIATYGKCPESTFNKYCWWVHENIREKYGLMDAPVPNQWNYVSDKCIEKDSSSGKNSSKSVKQFYQKIEMSE